MNIAGVEPRQFEQVEQRAQGTDVGGGQRRLLADVYRFENPICVFLTRISLISYLFVREGDSINTGNLGFLLAKASQRWNELLAERFAARGFTEMRPSYGSVLLPLFEQDGLRMGQIAERARLSKQTMTTMVRLCERDGLVYRNRDPADARAYRIHLTERAKAFKPVAAQVVRELDDQVLAALGQRGHDALSRALKGVMNV